jgi:serine/threonine protein kinase
VLAICRYCARGDLKVRNTSLTSPNVFKSAIQAAQKERQPIEPWVPLRACMRISSDTYVRCCSAGFRSYARASRYARTTFLRPLLSLHGYPSQVIHDSKTMHRDLKPENIFLSDSGGIKIGDFGLAYFAERRVYALCLLFLLGSPLHGAESRSPLQSYGD